MANSSDEDYLLGYSSSPKKTTGKEGSERPRTFRDCCALVTIEPYLILSIFASALETSFGVNLIVEKTCLVHYNFSEAVCANLDSLKHPQEQDLVQEFSAQMQMYRQFIINLPGVIYVLLLGSWSDRFGRKIPLILPMAGMFLMSLLYLANVYFWNAPPEFVLVAYIPMGLTGGMVGKYMAVWAYMSDVSDNRSRTGRFSVIYGIVYAVTPIGIFTSTVIFDNFYGYYGVFSVQALIFLAAIAYIVFCVFSVAPLSRRIESSDHPCCQAFMPSNIGTAFQVTLKERPNRGRLQVLLLILCDCVFVMCLELKDFDYLYTRKKFAWTYHEFNMWAMISTPLEVIGNAVVVPLLSYNYHMDDQILGIIGSISGVSFFVMMALATRDWQLYIATAMAFCTSMVSVSSRGILTKLVEPSEVGSIFSLYAVGEDILPMAFSPILMSVYSSTLDTFPGAIYLIGASLYLLMAFCFGALVLLKRRMNYEVI